MLAYLVNWPTPKAMHLPDVNHALHSTPAESGGHGRFKGSLQIQSILSWPVAKTSFPSIFLAGLMKVLS